MSVLPVADGSRHGSECSGARDHDGQALDPGRVDQTTSACDLVRAGVTGMSAESVLR